MGILNNRLKKIERLMSVNTSKALTLADFLILSEMADDGDEKAQRELDQRLANSPELQALLREAREAAEDDEDDKESW
jgi:hypothetical protein